ncbi:hypothetical protein [Taibaiella koreensis]|uniref:hypothetical protein n=1 Tax=Taibaiella koreensis TaxID=1268548 RepID=UPI000E5A02BB|nr:hypothetical protein [Taibaiella koreensis]
MNITDLVLESILNTCPTDKVAQNLSMKATLKHDLGLTGEEIYVLGLTVESRLPEGYTLQDDQITAWISVQDIIDTISTLLGKGE